MNNDHYIGSNEFFNPGHKFAATGLLANQNQVKRNLTASAKAKARKEFPYPPKGCEDAQQSIASMEEKIKLVTEALASGSKGDAMKENQALQQAYLDIKADFLSYINTAQCIKAAQAVEDETFTTQLTAALNAEEVKANTTGNKTNNILVFAILGVLMTGALILILRKKK